MKVEHNIKYDDRKARPKVGKYDAIFEKLKHGDSMWFTDQKEYYTYKNSVIRYFLNYRKPLKVKCHREFENEKPDAVLGWRIYILKNEDNTNKEQ